MSERTVYVRHQGAMIRRSGDRLRVVARRRTVAEVRLREVTSLVLVGNITFTPAALGAVVDRGIDTVLLTHHGRYRGRIVGVVSSTPRLRLAQYKLTTDTQACVRVGVALVRAKLASQRSLLQRHARRHGDVPALAVARRSLRSARMRAELCTSLDELRGCEGAGAAAYFRAFGALLRQPEFTFERRSRRPPLDPVNALLSLGYTLLNNLIEGCIRTVGLDPWLGVLHAPMAGRPSLACDIIEEFRVPIVDSLVVAAINRQSFRADGFEEAMPGEPVVLLPETVRWMITLFERRVNRPTNYAPLGVRLPWRQVIEHQVRAFARQVLHGEPYEPYAMR